MDNQTQSYSNYINIFFTMLCVSFISAIIPILIEKMNFSRFNELLNYYLEKFNLKKKEYKITLTSTSIVNRFGFKSNDINENKIAVLHFIQKNINNYKNLYKLKSDYQKSGYHGDQDFKITSFYKLDQKDYITIYKKNNYYINVICEDYSDKLISDKNKNESEKNVNNLILTSNKSIYFIKTFISKCIQEKKNDDDSEIGQYIYTYIGTDKNHKLLYDKEQFIPYANFNHLVGDNIKLIENNFDFFISDKGKKWYNDRGLAYQLTHLYYGKPGTGKSILASVIANKYNLHIIKISLSEMKSNREFTRVFKNNEYLGKTINYEKTLFVFDEIDIELKKMLENSKSIQDLIKDNVKSKNNINNNLDNNDKLELIINQSCSQFGNVSLARILEEINGINQMYGRKMIFITNNYNQLKNIHYGALIRPGRVDLTIKFNNLII